MAQHRRIRRIGTFAAVVVAVLAVLISFGLIELATKPATNNSQLVGIPFERVRVVRVIDGDTFVSDQGNSTSIRILGIDSCENTGIEKPGGRRATEQAQKLLPVGSTVTLIREEGVNLDMYDRALRYVRLNDGRDYGGVMVVENHTAVYQGENDSNRDYLLELRDLDKDGRNCV